MDELTASSATPLGKKRLDSNRARSHKAVSPVEAILLCALTASSLCAPTAWGLSGSEDDPLQDGLTVSGTQAHEDFLGGAFALSASSGGAKPEVQGFFISAKRWVSRDFGQPGEIKFHDQNGDKAVAQASQVTADVRQTYVKSSGGKFVAITARDSTKQTDSTDIYDLKGNRIATLPHHVAALSGNARFAALGDHSGIFDVASGKIIDLGLPADGLDSKLHFAEDTDSFASSYRRGKDVYLAAFTKDGALIWRKPVATGVSPFVRNAVFSPTGNYIAVAAGELPTDHFTLYDAAGRVLWTRDIPPGNYAMSFTADGSKLLLVHRDGHVLFRVSDGAVLWEKPFPLPEIKERGTLIATKVLISGEKFVIASRSALSNAPGKKPYQTINRVRGPDLIYTLDERGRSRILLNRPNGTLLIENGRFHYEPIVVIGGEPPEIYYLTRGGLRVKRLR